MACVLIFAMSLMISSSMERTFAWQNYSAAIGGESVYLADVALSAEFGEASVLKFSDADESIRAQQALLKSLTKLNYAERNTFFTNWFLSGLNNNYLHSASKAGEMSVIVNQYTFTNDSNISVCFRIDSAKVEKAAPGDAPDTAIAACWAHGAGSSSFNKMKEFLYNDGFFYCPVSIAPGESISVIFAAYIIDASNISGEYAFTADCAEIIQNTNNAVFFNEGWKDVAGKFLF